MPKIKMVLIDDCGFFFSAKSARLSAKSKIFHSSLLIFNFQLSIFNYYSYLCLVKRKRL